MTYKAEHLPQKKPIYKAWGATSTCWCAYLASFLISRQKKTGVRGICESRDLCFEDAESSSWKLRAEAANSPEVHVVVVVMDHSWAWLIMIDWLVVSNISYFPLHIWDVILPIDFHIFQDVKTTNQLILQSELLIFSPRALPEWWQPFGTGMEPTWCWSALLAALRLVDGCHIDVMFSWTNMSYVLIVWAQNGSKLHQCLPWALKLHAVCKRNTFDQLVLVYIHWCPPQLQVGF